MRGLIELATMPRPNCWSRDGHLIGEPSRRSCPNCIARCGRKRTQFRASMQCEASGNGESFLAEVWFSSYKEGDTKLAAIIATLVRNKPFRRERFGASGSEERPLSIPEMDVLRLVVQAYRIKKLRQAEHLGERVKNTLQQLFGKTDVRIGVNWFA